jgi:hypothetical protein
VEVALEAVADGFVQQHAVPAGAEHHVHLAGRAVDGVEIDQAWRRASSTWPASLSGAIQVSKPARPPAPDEPLSRLPSFSTVT